MPVNLTPTNAFPTNFRAPGDGDPANGATFQAGHQDAADAATYLKTQVDNHALDIAALQGGRVVASGARYLIKDGTGATTDLEFEEVFADSGFALVSSNKAIQVPAPGRYLISWRTRARSGTTNPVVDVGSRLRVGGTNRDVALATRWDDSAGTHVLAHGRCTAFITTPATETIQLRPVAGTGEPAVADYQAVFDPVNYIEITRVSA